MWAGVVPLARVDLHVVDQAAPPGGGEAADGARERPLLPLRTGRRPLHFPAIRGNTSGTGSWGNGQGPGLDLHDHLFTIVVSGEI